MLDGNQSVRRSFDTLSCSVDSFAGGDEALQSGCQSMAFSGEFEGFCFHLTSRAGNVDENLTEKNLTGETRRRKETDPNL